MGKKLKVGKTRKDKFYHLAKETGYRARSSFKLLQLNRKYEFLQKARVCIDLCAAPGGWLQVASECMPMSSVIIGVDLVPIKPVPKCSTFQEDITTEKCRQVIKKELQTWKADVVLHDGAPNVGKNWIHDAFAQAELTLSALKLATVFLKKGGWFITKVFRSKDYQTLIWVFGQMFKKVHATKPKASRNESAEIFVVCQGYLAPDKIDPKFLDPRHVFKDINADAKPTINLIHPEKVKKNAEGYADGTNVLFNRVPAINFIKAENHLEVLASASELVFDNDGVKTHPLTTTEIQECCKDIRVLGKRELRDILTWRKKMIEVLEKQDEKKKTKAEEEQVGKIKHKSITNTANTVTEVEEVDMEASDGGSSEDSAVQSDLEDEEKVKEQLAELKDEERRVAKRKRKKVMKEKRQLRDKMSLNMVIPGDQLDITDDISLFDLKKIKNKQQLTDVEKEQMSDHEEGPEMADMDPVSRRRKNLVAYERYGKQEDDSDIDSDLESLQSMDMELEEGDSGEEDEDPAAETGDNPLVVEMESKEAKAKNKMELWFKKAGFEGLEGESDEDIEIEKMTEVLKERGGHVIGKSSENQKSEKQRGRKKDIDGIADTIDAKNAQNDDDDDDDAYKALVKENRDLTDSDSDSDSSSSDSESDYEMYSSVRETLNNATEKTELCNKANKDGFEIVSQEVSSGRKFTKLDPVELALGEEMIKSSKRRRELIDDSYNRYTFGEEENLPDWFVKDEAKHMKRQLPISKSQIEKYRERLKAINARPIKKIAEAQARKKKRMVRKMEKARQKAEKISEAEDVSNKEKMKAIKDVYKRAGILKKKKEDVQYVVAKRGTGKKVSRPPGIKGRFKVVDPRMKKDIQKQKMRDRQSKKKAKGKQKGGRKR